MTTKKRPTAKEARAIADETARRERADQAERDLRRALDALPDYPPSHAYNTAVDAARDVLSRFHYLQDALKEAEAQVEDLRAKVASLEDDLSDNEYAIAEAAETVCTLVPKVLGREDCIAEALPVFELRRAVEDLRDAIP